MKHFAVFFGAFVGSYLSLHLVHYFKLRHIYRKNPKLNESYDRALRSSQLS